MMLLSLPCFTDLFISAATVIALCISSATVDFDGSLSAPVEFSKENFRKLAIANNDLSLRIHRQLASERKQADGDFRPKKRIYSLLRSEENIFFSPLSLSTAFGMLYYGTRGETAKELIKVLGYERAGLPQELIHQTFHKYLTESLPSRDPSAYVLNSANAILLDKHLDLVSSYKTDVEYLYKASVRDVDFRTQSSQVTSEINNWVKGKTNGKIKKLLNGLHPTTPFVILNAVYFKGTWKSQFEPSLTRPGFFFNYGDQSKKVTMMRMKEHFSYTEDAEVQVLEMPYKGENVSMIFLLPKQLDGLEKLEMTISLEKLSTFRHQLRKIKIDLTIPKFKVEYSKDLSGVFHSIGAESIFTPGADFSGMITTPNVFVSEVIHKAVVEVNEEGSEAAGATAIFGGRSAAPREPEFTVNRPFFFAIVDKRNDMILFQGRITNL